MLWLSGVGLAPEPVGSSGTGRRKSYSRRINRDKLNNCALVRGATTAQHKHCTDSMPYGHQHNISCVFICQLLTLQLAGFIWVHKCRWHLSLSKQCVVRLLYSTLARSNMHVHHGTHWVVKLILPLATLSLCSGEAWGRAGRASSSLWRPHVGGFWAQGLQGWSGAKQLYSGQPETQSASRAGPGPRSLWAVGDAAGGQPEHEGSCCLDLCFRVKMNLFPSVCKQDLLTQEIIINVVTCCWCALRTHGNMPQSQCRVMEMQNSIYDCITSCCLNVPVLCAIQYSLIIKVKWIVKK